MHIISLFYLNSFFFFKFNEATPYSSDSHIKFRGLVHIRVANVGSPFNDINGI
jgi:hypothetical protein